MLKSLTRVCILSVFLVCLANPVLAWDESGHKITAYIAWQQMTPDVRERVIKILLAAPEDAQLSTFYAGYGSRTSQTRKREYFMLVATWADIIRDRNFDVRFKKYHHANWHYSDTFWTKKDGKIEIIPSPDDGGQAAVKLAELDKVIRGTASDSEKAIAIAWLEHLIGDIHQPLHASGRVTDTEPKGDQGANLFLLTPKGTPRDKQENLHWFWDSIIGRNIPNTADVCEADYLDPIAVDIMKKFPFSSLQGRLKPGNFEEWKKESFEIASTDVYPPDLKRNETPSDKYRKAAFKISQERMALAGYRMGALFNEVFATPPPVK